MAGRGDGDIVVLLLLLLVLLVVVLLLLLVLVHCILCASVCLRVGVTIDSELIGESRGTEIPNRNALPSSQAAFERETRSSTHHYRDYDSLMPPAARATSSRATTSSSISTRRGGHCKLVCLGRLNSTAVLLADYLIMMISESLSNAEDGNSCVSTNVLNTVRSLSLRV